MLSLPHRRLNAIRQVLLPIATLAVILSCASTNEELGPLGEWAQTEEALNEAEWANHLTSTAIAALEAEMHAAQTAEAAPISRDEAIQTAQAEAAAQIEAPAAAQPPPAEAPAPALAGAAPPSGSSPPVITRVDFLKSIPATGTKFSGWVSFTDPDGDVNLMTLEVISAETMKGWQGDPNESLQGTRTEGRYRMQFWCYNDQQITMRVTLVDAAGNQSNSMEFSFECY